MKWKNRMYRLLVIPPTLTEPPPGFLLEGKDGEAEYCISHLFIPYVRWQFYLMVRGPEVERQRIVAEISGELGVTPTRQHQSDPTAGHYIFPSESQLMPDVPISHVLGPERMTDICNELGLSEAGTVIVLEMIAHTAFFEVAPDGLGTEERYLAALLKQQCPVAEHERVRRAISWIKQEYAARTKS